MRYEVDFFDKNGDIVEGLFFETEDPKQAAQDSIEQAVVDGIEYDYAQLFYGEGGERLLATYKKGEWNGNDDEWIA